ncbi:MAG: transposase [Firmicutes bacterium]|nr:transposase [Bacillota bacterium]
MEKNRNWSKEEKLRIVLRNLDDKVGQWTIAKEENISRGQVHSWIKKSLEGGPDARDTRTKT